MTDHHEAPPAAGAPALAAGVRPAGMERRWREAPEHCVWELTLACNARCACCGSAAGVPRPDELDRSEALAVAAELAELGCERVTLMGGEPLVRADWPALARALSGSGVVVEMVSNGWLLDAAAAAELVAAGVHSVSVSIDGAEPTHDRLRGVDGGYRRAIGAVRAARAAGLPVGVVTQVNRANLRELGALYPELCAAGALGWQLQLSEAMGRCSDRGLLLAPEELPVLERFVLDVVAEGRLWAYAADNVGYMSRDEPLLRSGKRAADRCWLGCQAGLGVLGITSHGMVRGCMALPEPFDEGSVRSRALREIWTNPRAFAYNRVPGHKVLRGACGRCPFARVCGAGCSSLCFSATGALGDNPYCLSRLLPAGGRAGQP
jgi:radical SAM protein with 4Fe4S-binding SPASM domain